MARPGQAAARIRWDRRGRLPRGSDPGSLRYWSLVGYWFATNFQTAALITIVAPILVTRLAAAGHTAVLARLATVGELVALGIPPLAGAASDRLRARGHRRRGFVVAATVVNMLGLLAAVRARSQWTLTAAVVIAILGASAGGTAFQAWLPELVPPERWGTASGYLGLASLLGNAAGLVVAGFTPPQVTVVAMAAVSGTGAAMVWRAPIGEQPGLAAARPRPPRRAFHWVLVARLLVLFGQTMLMTFILYFFSGVLHVARAAGVTAGLALLAVLGAAVSAWVMGRLSDRLAKHWNRARIVAAASLPMALATIAFGMVGQVRGVLGFALVYGLGYGAFLSVDWALALDTLPDLAHVARDLGIWGMAAGFPAVLAPAVGGWVLTSAPNPAAGYHRLFWLAGLSMAAGSAVVWRLAGRRRPAWQGWAATLLCLAVATVLQLATMMRFRFRMWGQRGLRGHGAVLVVGNHTHDLDSAVIPSRLYCDGPWREPVISAGAQRLFEPAFVAARLPLRWGRYLAWLNVGPILWRLGVRPLENEPLARSLLAWSFLIYRRWGNLPAPLVWDAAVTAELAEAGGHGDLRLSDTWRGWALPISCRSVTIRGLREPYRSRVRETLRADIEAQLARLADELRRGRTVYLTPEGRLTTTGAVGPLRAALGALLAVRPRVVVAAAAYDVLAPGRMPVWCHIAAPPQPEDLRRSLAALRPLTASHVVAAVLRAGQGRCPAVVLAHRVRQCLADLPTGAVLAPDIRRQPMRAVNRVIDHLLRKGWLERRGEDLVIRGPWRDARFSRVSDLADFLTVQWEETVRALAPGEQVTVPPRPG